MKYGKFYLLAFLVIFLDQALKLWVYYNMEMGSGGEIKVLGDVFKLHYVLNEGMAFGLKFESPNGKLFLTLFRWIAMSFIGFYVYYCVKTKVHQGFVWCMSLILAGACGNVIDSTFYGVYLPEHASIYPDNSQALFYPWFHGKVIDMFYVDIWQGRLPDWIPLMGGKYYSFWPIFNIADSSIFVGVTIILIFQNTFFPPETAVLSTATTNEENLSTNNVANE